MKRYFLVFWVGRVIGTNELAYGDSTVHTTKGYYLNRGAFMKDTINNSNNRLDGINITNILELTEEESDQYWMDIKNHP